MKYFMLASIMGGVLLLYPFKESSLTIPFRVYEKIETNAHTGRSNP